ncbi:MAG: MBL fold metallo-hydrolase [Myxococcota bacterium]
MKRVLLVFGGLLLVLILTVGGIMASTFGSIAPLVDGQTVGVATTIQDGYVAAYLIDVGDGVMLIDAGNDAKAEAITAALAKQHRGPDDVRAIFLTHGHPDHVAGVSHFPKAAIYALDREVPIVEGKEATRGPLPRLFGANPHPVQVTRGLTNSSSITVGNKLVEVFALPGHTAGSAAYLVEGALFVGDSAGADKAGHLMGAPWVFSDSQPENVAALHALAKTLGPRAAEVKWIVPAHSAPLPGLAPLSSLP